MQVLEALLRNALERMPQGAALTIRTSQRQDVVELSMRYPARDIRADEAEHFFYPFSTSPPASDEIDLPMCKIIIGKHGGAINVCVEPAEEFVIRMSLPIQDDRKKTAHS